MICIACNSKRVASVTGKTGDCCGVCVGNKSSEGHVPDDMNIGGGDFLNFYFCLTCGTIQGLWPLLKTKIEQEEESEEKELE